MLNVLKSLLCDIECGIIMLDFEKASMNAFTQVFDQFSLLNCFFHLYQSVQPRIQKSFKVKYRTDKDFALASRLVVFQAFVPPEQQKLHLRPYPYTFALLTLSFNQYDSVLSYMFKVAEYFGHKQ